MKRIGYHVTPKSNLEDILKFGLHSGKDGIDGAGIYLWVNPNFFSNIFQCVCHLDNFVQVPGSTIKEFKDSFAIFEVSFDDQLPHTSKESVDYICIHIDTLLPESIKFIGSFIDLENQYGKSKLYEYTWPPKDFNPDNW